MNGMSRAIFAVSCRVKAGRSFLRLPVTAALHAFRMGGVAPTVRTLSATAAALPTVLTAYAKPKAEGRILPVVTYPAEPLRKKAEPVADVSATDVQQLAADLLATAASQMGGSGCLGLAAPQLGASLRMMALRTPRFNNEGEVMAHRKAKLAQARASRPSVGRSRSPGASRRKSEQDDSAAAGGAAAAADASTVAEAASGVTAAATPAAAAAADDSTPRYHVCINPTILDRSAASEYVVEGCLSLPDIATLVRRSRRITVAWTDVDGTQRRALLEGMPAVAFQHELDHLDGVVQTDREVKTLPPPGAASSKGGLAYRSLRDAFEAAAQRANMEVAIYYELPQTGEFSLPGRNVNLLDDY